MVRFQANLSASSLNALANKLTEYTNNLEQAQAEIVQALTDYVYERIMAYVPVDTGTLQSSFIKEISSEIGRVYTDLYYAKYVEFGTGIRGNSSGYDLTKIKLSDSWRGYKEDYTGQVAQKFIYRAVLDLEANYQEIVKNILREKGLI